MAGQDRARRGQWGRMSLLSQLENGKAAIYGPKLARCSMAKPVRAVAARRIWCLLVGSAQAASYIWAPFVKRLAPKRLFTGP